MFCVTLIEIEMIQHRVRETGSGNRNRKRSFLNVETVETVYTVATVYSVEKQPTPAVIVFHHHACFVNEDVHTEVEHSSATKQVRAKRRTTIARRRATVGKNGTAIVRFINAIPLSPVLRYQTPDCIVVHAQGCESSFC